MWHQEKHDSLHIKLIQYKTVRFSAVCNCLPPPSLCCRCCYCCLFSLKRYFVIKKVLTIPIPDTHVTGTALRNIHFPWLSFSKKLHKVLETRITTGFVHTAPRQTTHTILTGASYRMKSIFRELKKKECYWKQAHSRLLPCRHHDYLLSIAQRTWWHIGTTAASFTDINVKPGLFFCVSVCALLNENTFLRQADDFSSSSPLWNLSQVVVYTWNRRFAESKPNTRVFCQFKLNPTDLIKYRDRGELDRSPTRRKPGNPLSLQQSLHIRVTATSEKIQQQQTKKKKEKSTQSKKNRRNNSFSVVTKELHQLQEKFAPAPLVHALR